MSVELEEGSIVAERYRVGRPIGEGGMGAVYEAENILTERRVALKWIQRGAAQKEEAQRRLLREAKLAARIEHPHVVDVYDVGRDGDSVFLVMELLRGETLSDVYKRRGAMPPEELLAQLTPVLGALATVHAKHIVHRDLKPSNIFLCRVEGRKAPVPKLLDFGIARDNEGSTNITGTGQVLGTPAYMAPEQIDGGQVSERTDVYAMGVILYEGLTGQRPFVGKSVFQLVQRIMEGDPTPPHELRHGVPEALSEAVLKAIQNDPDQRYASIGELTAALSPYAPTSSATSSSLYPTMVPAPPSPRRGPRASPWMILAVVAGLAVTVGAVYPLLQGSSPDVAPEPVAEPATEPEEPPIDPPAEPEPTAEEPSEPGPVVDSEVDLDDPAPNVEADPDPDPEPAAGRRRSQRRGGRGEPSPEEEEGSSRFGLESDQF